jgi:hypothetical protein
MKTLSLSIAFLVCGLLPSIAQTTPLAQTIAEESETTITCELNQAPIYSEVPVFYSPNEAEAAKGTYHYKVWIPKGYHQQVTKHWPCMFVMSASGNASMEHMGDYLKRNGYIVVMLVEAKNGQWPPIVGNFLAAHDDVTKRLRVGAKFATGQSGGARASSVFVQLRPGFEGLILQSAGASLDAHGKFNVTGLKCQPHLRIAMVLGKTDKNFGEIARMKSLLSGPRFADFVFDGGHTWAPTDVFEKAMAWVTEKGSSAEATTPGTAGGSFDEIFNKK